MLGRKWAPTKGFEPGIHDEDLRAMIHFLAQIDRENLRKWMKNLDKHRLALVLAPPICEGLVV